MRKIAIGRTIALTVVIICFSMAAYCVWQAHLHDLKVRQWVDDRPMDTPVDLSKPGELRVPFRQTCSISHGEMILLELTPPIKSDRELDVSFQDLVARLLIADQDGNVVESIEIHETKVCRYSPGEDIYVARFDPFAKGDYTATLTIESGAANLTVRQQRLYAKYFICGCEQFPAALSMMAAIFFGFIGLVVFLYILPTIIRHGMRRVEKSEDDMETEQSK